MNLDPILIQKQKESLLALADAMAEAATEFKGQGYHSFLETREKFKQEVDKVFETYGLSADTVAIILKAKAKA